MPLVRVAATLLLACLSLLAGCPLAVGPAGGQGSAADNSTVAGPLGVTGPGGGNGAPVDAFDRHLQEAFPDCGTTPSADAWRLTILRLVNAARAEYGLNPVRYSQALEEQATQYACELIHYDFFGHDNPYTGTTLADRAVEFGYQYFVIGENLAAGQRTPEQAFNDWMESPGHRANILDARFTELGIGIRTGGTYGAYWVQEFGRPVTEPF